jgi:hypothetical protein
VILKAFHLALQSLHELVCSLVRDIELVPVATLPVLVMIYQNQKDQGWATREVSISHLRIVHVNPEADSTSVGLLFPVRSTH